MLGANELMNSRLSGSEEVLAEHACDRIGERAGPRMLIGGLGMGFTLRAALARLPLLVYGAADPKAGAVDTLFAIGQDPRLNHRFLVERGVLGDACAGVLRSFFGALRAKRKAAPPGAA